MVACEYFTSIYSPGNNQACSFCLGAGQPPECGTVIHQIQINSTGELKDIPVIGDLLDRFCQLHQVPEKIRYHLRLALDELLTNTVSHGFSSGEGENFITIRASLSPPWLVTEVQDNGPPFNPLAKPTPDLELPVESRPIGGLGIHLVRSVIDQLDYRHHENCNILLLKQILPGNGSQEHEPCR